MKKTILTILCVIILLISFCSCDKIDTKIEEVSSDTELSERIGFTIDVPETVKYETFTIIDNTVGQAKFTFNGYIFVYRGSKLSADASLYQIDSNVVGTVDLTIDTRAVVNVKSLENGGRVAVWNYNGTNYTLYAQKSASDDVFTELLDLLIK